MLSVYRIRDIVKRISSDRAYGLCKVFVDNVCRDTDSFKDLAALVRLDRRDTHLGSDLYDAFKYRIVVIVCCRIIVFVEKVVLSKYAICHKAIKDIRFPKYASIAAIYRNYQIIIPSGSIVIEPKDTLVMVTAPANAKNLLKYVEMEPAEPAKPKKPAPKPEPKPEPVPEPKPEPVKEEKPAEEPAPAEKPKPKKRPSKKTSE